MSASLDILFLTATAALVVAILYMLKAMFSRDKDAEIERLRRENRELRRECREEIERLKRHYETLLKDAAIRNVMMRGLWEAYRSGELTRCYEEGGYIKVLADGTVVCYKAEEEESYAIRTEFKEPEVRIEALEEPEVSE